MKVSAFDRRAHPQAARFSTWQAPDGWIIRRMDWMQDDANAARGSVLFAGGRGDFIEKYLEADAHWHGRGWNVTAFDWRGQGASRGDILGGNFTDFEPLVQDAAALVADWIARSPAPHFVIGHSMGGHLTLRLIVEHRPALAGAVLVAPMIGINSSPLPAWLATNIAAGFAGVGLGQAPVWLDNGPAGPGSSRQRFLTSCEERYSDELWWYEREPGYRLGAPSWGWLAAAYRSMARLTPERLRAIDLPILFVATDTDRLVSPSAIREAAGLISGAELLMFPAAGHEILREADPVRLEALQRIDAFLERHR